MHLTVDVNWEESKHPRGQPGNAGEFASGSGGSSKSKAQALAPAQRVNGKLTAANGAALPSHIAKLRIPPAWQDVHYAADPKSTIYATGKDAKGRRQYVYSPEFSSQQAQAKFARIKELDQKFQAVRKQNDENRKSADPKVREAADAMHLIMQMGIRPGSEADTKAAKKAYGATTLEGRHLVQLKGGSRLRFTGKKGVALDLPIGDAETAKMLAARAEQAGRTGKLFPTLTDKSLLAYAHSLDGGGFKTKDFRTLLGTRSAQEAMHGLTKPKNDREFKKAVHEVAKRVAAKLGNTPTVALQSYINPAVFAPWKSLHAAS